MKNEVKTIEETTLEAPEPTSESGVPAPETSSSSESAVTVPENGVPPSQKQVSQRPAYTTLMYDLVVKSTPWFMRDFRPADYDNGRGSVKILNALQPQNALDATACALLTGISNAVHDNLGRAGRNGVREVRDTELKNAFKGALVAEKLIGRIESLRSKPGTVQVDNVRIEAGGMAILGHVETGPRESASSPDQPLAPEKKKRRRKR
jgi:hypothetical protein